MKKVAIITVQNSLNYGAYLQAYALSKTCSEINKNTYFINTKARKPYKETFKQIVKALLNFNFKKIGYELTLIKKYKKAWKEFKIISPKDIDKEDICITGSDEIWNISRKEMLNFPIFFGIGVNTNNIVSYAPSCNTTSIELFKKNPQLIEALKKFKAISVRDNHTKDVVSELIGKDIIKVLDPTLLKTKDYYKTKEKIVDINGKYILVYSYSDDIKPDEVKQIKEYATKNDLKLVAVGLHLNWCDINIAASPMEFLGLVDKAEKIITSTFHGTIFSFIYRKNFIVYPGNKNKVLNFLEDWNLQDRSTKIKKFTDIVEEEINYDIIESKINKEIEKSKQYIKNILK